MVKLDELSKVTPSSRNLLEPVPEFAQLILTELIESVSPTLLVITHVTLSLLEPEPTAKVPTVKLDTVQLYAVAVSAAGRLVTGTAPMLAAEVLCTRVEEPVPDGWV